MALYKQGVAGDNIEKYTNRLTHWRPRTTKRGNGRPQKRWITHRGQRKEVAGNKSYEIVKQKQL